MDKNKKVGGLPLKFLERLANITGLSLFHQIAPTFAPRPTTFRVNTIKAEKFRIKEELLSQGFKIREVSWYKDAFILLNKSKRDLTDLPMYEEGKIYLQSLASMVPPLILAPSPGDKVLDLTAAPGSKTSEMAALMNKQGELVANDNNKIRFFKLKHNLEILGVAQTYPVDTDTALSFPCRGESSRQMTLDSRLRGNDRRQLGTYGIAGAVEGWKLKLRLEHGGDLCREYPEYFDKILLDAPCSAEARFIEGDAKTTGYWKENKIKEMAYKQWGLLLAAWSALKPGGTLVYSTCTFAPEENELPITKFLERNKNAEVMPINIPDFKKISPLKEWKGKLISAEVAKNCLRIMPTKEIEGFFVVKIKKTITK
ncbi:MAG: RsmB/NOP family class I SAM-dependent RNA methyltransferase [Patescibacteria group bacterium]